MQLTFNFEDPDDNRRRGLVHLLMPSMAFACGKTMLELRKDRWVMGLGDWDKVTCEACTEDGIEAVIRRRCWQQDREDQADEIIAYWREQRARN